MLKLPHGFLLLYDMRPFIISFNNMSFCELFIAQPLSSVYYTQYVLIQSLSTYVTLYKLK